jgi:hypothetical protein
LLDRLTFFLTRLSLYANAWFLTGLNCLLLCFAVGGVNSGSCAAQHADVLQDNVLQDKMQSINPRIAAPFKIDLERVAAHGIRLLESEHLLLFTDTRQEIGVEEFPRAFDLAVGHWCNYFSIDKKRAKQWKMRAFIIENKDRFQKAGLFPDSLPPFPAGFQFGRDMWVYVQSGPYYTRHLLLHEGCHAFMEWFLDGWGSPWYSEGMAEKLGLHHWISGGSKNGLAEADLKLDFAVTDKSQVPYWGRINLIKKDLERDQGLALQQVISLPSSAFREVRYYGWAWAACQFLSKHELTRDVFDQLKRHVAEGQARFDARLFESLGPHLDSLERDWVLFIDELDYGLDVSKVILAAAQAGTATGTTKSFRIDSAKAWQVTSLTLRVGDRIRIRCRSRIQVGQTVKNGQAIPWTATADGITLKYYRGRPLGVLLAGTLGDAPPSRLQLDRGIQTEVIGSAGELMAKSSGRLCLRINESPAEMQDNQGVLEVEIDEVK